MAVADKKYYLGEIVNELNRQWPVNRTVNIVCHGHSVPAGYFVTPTVDTFNSYPHLLHRRIKDRYPFACVNVIVTAVGGEDSQSGSRRFRDDVLCHRPDIVLIDYGLNDRRIGTVSSYACHREMILAARGKNTRVILLTPSWDTSYIEKNIEWHALIEQAEQIRALAAEYETGLVDSFALFDAYVNNGGELSSLLSQRNHPNRNGHLLIADALSEWFEADTINK